MMEASKLEGAILKSHRESAGSASALLGLFSFVIGAIVDPLVGLGGGNTALPMGIVIAVSEIGAILSYVLLRRRKSSGASELAAFDRVGS
ncbi:MAG: hypothetical protein P4L69_05345 [Desulfosporosinus sp.]|nr:hypothetical protein [Desulfosporosinus sp.]